MGQSLEEFQAMIAERQRRARELSLDYIDEHGRAYSRELRDWLKTGGVDLHIGRVQALLKDLEAAGVLTSWLVRPPHDDGSRGGLQRRYYRRVIK